MTHEERVALKRALRAQHEMRIRQSLARFQFQLSLARRSKVPMAEVCQMYEAIFPLIGMAMIGNTIPIEERELNFEVFKEIMADCRNEAFRWESV